MKIGYGSTLGASHRKLDYNNQDAVLITQIGEVIIGVVADGCGSGSNSEVGAQLAVKRISKIIHEKIKLNVEWKHNLKEEMQTYAKILSELHDSDQVGFVQDYLLFTLIGFVKLKDSITIFSFGDGVIVIDDNIQIIDQNNRPKYLNNELKNEEGADFHFLEFKYEGQKILIGSDGVEDLMEGIRTKRIREYPMFNSFLEDELNYIDPLKIPKLLQKYSSLDVLKDDCTLIMMMG